MPTLRVLSGERLSLGAPGRIAADGVADLAVGASDTIRLALDYSGWLAGAAIVADTWDGAQVQSPARTGAVCSGLIALQGYDDGYPAVSQALAHTVTASDGRVRRQGIRLNAGGPRLVSSDFTLDVSAL